MAELDPAEVESMIAENGLNEVTLKVRCVRSCLGVVITPSSFFD